MISNHLVEKTQRFHEARRLRRVLSHRTVLAFSVSLALCGGPGNASSTTVTNCFESGVGSLRNAVTTAPEGDTVSMTGLTTSSDGCAASKVTLTTGDIVVGQRNLTIIGPASMNLVITGKDSLGKVEPHRIITHNAGGSGMLTVDNLTLDHGKLSSLLSSPPGFALGACLYSLHDVQLNHVRLENRSADAAGGGALAFGGALWAKGNITIANSAVVGNMAHTANGTARGGGIFASNNLTIRYSVISGNSAIADGGDAEGGGVHAHGLMFTWAVRPLVGT